MVRAPSRSRNLPRLTVEEMDRLAVERHTRLVGEVAWAWNDLHAVFGYVFGGIVAPQNPLLGQALWTTLASDAAQREMLETAIEYGSLKRADRVRLRWAIKETSELRVHRNDVIHAPASLLLTGKGVTTTLAHTNSFRRYLRYLQNDTRLVPLMVMLHGDLRKLADYVTDVWRSFPDDQLPPRPPSPRRPRLKLVRTLAGRKIQIAGPSRSRKRKARPRSSRASRRPPSRGSSHTP